MPNAAGEAVDRFLTDFLAPVMAGGEATVGRPLSLVHLEAAEHARPADSEADGALYAGLHHGASAIAAVARLPYPDHGTWALGMAAHDLLALTDPLLDRAGARRAVPYLVAAAEALVVAAGIPGSRGELLSRHALITRLLDLSRADVVVKNWAYTYRFPGRPVPANVVALPKLRRVRTTESTKPALVLLEEAAAKWSSSLTISLGALVSASPLTRLLGEARVGPLRYGLREAAALADPPLRRAVARAMRAMDEEGLARHGAALDSPTADALPLAARVAIAALYYDLGVEEALDRGPAGTLARLARGTRGMQRGAALFALGATAERDGGSLDGADMLAARELAHAVIHTLDADALAAGRAFLDPTRAETFP